MKKWYLLFFATTAMFLSILACKTPVFKYALLNWEGRDIYQIIRIYDGKKNQAEEDPAVKELLKENILANVTYYGLDIDNHGQGDEFDKEIKNLTNGKELPYHIVLNPSNNIVHQGNFELADIKNILQSPKRLEMCNYLAKGHIVMLYVKSDEKKQHEEITKMLKEELPKISEEELQYRKAMARDFPEEVEEAPENMKAIKIAYVEIDPNDPLEKFFANSLINLSPYVAKEPLPKIFGVVGRGFVFEDYLSKDLMTPQQIGSLVSFLSGPCSCTVKSGNPGGDILTNFDWDKNINMVNPEDNKEAEKVEGFGGDEVEMSEKETKDPVTTEDQPKDTVSPEKPIKKAESDVEFKNETPATAESFVKIILYAVIGIGIALLILTSVLKGKKE